MKLSSNELGQVRAALEAVEPSAFGLADVDVYPGASRYSARSVVACRFGADHREVVTAACGKAALAASSRLGIEIAWGVETGTDEATCWIEYFPGGLRPANALFTLQALRTALVAGAAEGSSAALREAERLEKIAAPEIFVQSRFLVAAARRADIPVENVAGTDAMWRFGWGSRSDIFFGTASLGDSIPGNRVTWKKHLAKTLFRELGLPTPKWRVLSKTSDPVQVANQLGWPCVVKPLDQAFGRGVTANVTSEAELRQALALARQHSSSIMIEAHQPGSDHRLMVIDGRLVAAARRDPPAVTGDGRSTIAELLAHLNVGRDGTSAAGFLLPVERDAELDAMLARRGYSVESVLPSGETVLLRSIANFSTGGTAVDVTSKVHPQIRGAAELLAVAVGLRTAGIDYITPDISKSHAEAGGGFIEVNAMPRLRLLMAHGQGEGAIPALLLGDRPGRIPVILLIATAEAIPALAGAMAERISARPRAAAATPQSAQVGATVLPHTGLRAFELVSSILRHSAVDELVVLWTPEHVQRFGLPVDDIARAIVVDADVDEICLTPYCREIVRAEGADAALEAAFRS